MSVADRIDHLRADAWLLARRTGRRVRHWQSRWEQAADRLPGHAEAVGEQIQQVADRLPHLAAKVGRWLRRQGRRMGRQVDAILPWTGPRPVAERLTSLTTAADLATARMRRLSQRIAARIADFDLASRRDDAAESLQALVGPVRRDLGARLKAAGEWLDDTGETVPAARRALRRWWWDVDTAGRRAVADDGVAEAATATGMAALWHRLTRRRERSGGHPVAWWLGFGVALALTALWVRNRRITASLRHVTPEPGETVRRFPTAFGDLAYREAGVGPPLVLIHGLGPGASHHLYDRNVSALARHFRVFALDLLGFGMSDKPDITYTGERQARVVGDFLREVVGQPATVVAAGAAAGFVAHALAQHPELASHLVLMNPVGEARPSLGRRLMAAIDRLPVIEHSLYYTMTGRRRIADRLRSRYFANPEQVDDHLIDQFVANARQPGADRAVRDLLAGHMAMDLPCELANLSVPVSLIWGRHAERPPLEAAQTLLQAAPSATLCVFENSAMFPQADEADGFNQFLIDRCAAPAANPGRQGSGQPKA